MSSPEPTLLAAPRNVRKVDTDAATVESRYSKETGHAFDSETAGMRKVHNWIKSCLIGLAPKENGLFLDLACGRGGDIQKWRQRSPRYVAMADLSRDRLREAISRYDQLINEILSRKLVGQNPNENRLDAEEEVSISTKEVFAADFIRCNFKENYLGDHFTPSVSYEGITPLFNFSSCQFAIHYAFETQETAINAFKNAADLLVPGSLFVATFPDSGTLIERVKEVVHDPLLEGVQLFTDLKKEGLPPGSRLRIIPDKVMNEDEISYPEVHLGRGGQPVCGNPRYRVRFEPLPSDIDDLPPFGVCYKFWLGDESVKNIPEYLITPDGLRIACEAANLELVMTQTFSEFYDSIKGSGEDVWGAELKREFSALFDRFKVPRRDQLPLDLWEITSLYRLAVFRRIPARAGSYSTADNVHLDITPGIHPEAADQVIVNLYKNDQESEDDGSDREFDEDLDMDARW